jgi:solute carrier family 25 S-adenosylmethionine transporter 26
VQSLPVTGNQSEQSFITTYTNENLYQNVYDGLIPSLLGGVPAGSVFFGVKDFSKSFLREAALGLDKQTITVLSVIIASFPYWILRTPSEILKTQEQIGVLDRSMPVLLQRTSLLANSFLSNMLYALPADLIKFLACELVPHPPKLRYPIANVATC